MKKIYCENCKHCFSQDFGLASFFRCATRTHYKSNWYAREKVFVACDIRNKHNDCKYFEKVELEPEKIQAISPLPEIKKKFWDNKEWRKHWGLK